MHAARDADAVLVSGFRILGVPAVLATRLRGTPCVLKGDSRGEMSGEFFRAGIARWHLTPRSFVVRLFVGLRNGILRRAEGFIALSDEMAQEFAEHAITTARVHRIPNGVDVEHFRPASPVERCTLRRNLGLPDGPLAVYTGRLVTYKGLPLLLRAWKAAQQAGVHATLVLVGEGGADMHACETELREFVREHSLESCVRFTGAVANVADYLRAADFFVFPTTDEAFGLSLVEAMACGLPVISTAVGGIRDFLVDGVNGIAVPVGDEGALVHAIRRVAAGGDETDMMAHAARETALTKFSQESVAEKLVQLFQSLAGPRPEPTPR
jgi:glycosyltransferase involved in cell wall biosynthesis